MIGSPYAVGDFGNITWRSVDGLVQFFSPRDSEGSSSRSSRPHRSSRRGGALRARAGGHDQRGGRGPDPVDLRSGAPRRAVHRHRRTGHLLGHPQHLHRRVQPVARCCPSTAAMQPSPPTSGCGRRRDEHYHVDVAKLLPIDLRGRARAGASWSAARSTSTSSIPIQLAGPVWRFPMDAVADAAADPPDHGRRRAGGWWCARHGAVDDDHQDGRRRRHPAADLRAGRGRGRHRALHLQRARGRPRVWPGSCPGARCRSWPTSTISTGGPSRRSRPACTACGSTRATSASPSTSRRWPSEAKDRGVPIRIGVNGGILAPRPLREVRRPGDPRGHGRVGACRRSPTSRRSTST